MAFEIQWALKIVAWLSVIGALLGLEIRSARRYAQAFQKPGLEVGVQKRKKPFLRASNVLILSGAGYYAYDCLTHFPFGESRLSVTLCVLAILLGFLVRNWED